MVGEKVYLDDASVIFKGICKLTFSSTERVLPMRFLYVGCGRVGPTGGGGVLLFTRQVDWPTYWLSVGA